MTVIYGFLTLVLIILVKEIFTSFTKEREPFHEEATQSGIEEDL